MVRATAIEKLIRRVDSSELHLEPGEILLIFDVKKGKVLRELPKRNLLSVFTADKYRYYVVSTKSTTHYVSDEKPVESQRDSNAKLEIKALCTLQCAGQNIGEFVKAISRNARSPEVLINQLISNEIDDFFFQNPNLDPVNDFFIQKEALELQIARKFAAFGIRATVKLDAGQHDLTTLEIDDQLVFHLAQDSALDLEFHFAVSLEVENDDRSRSKAAGSYGRESQLAGQVSDTIKSWLEESYASIDDLHLDEGNIPRKIRSLIVPLAKEFGRKIGKFDVAVEYPFDIPQRTVLQFEHTQRLGKKEILFTHSAHLDVTSMSKFRKSKIQDIDSWCASIVEGELSNSLVGKTATFIANRYSESMVVTISKTLETKGEKAGITVVHFESKSNAKPDRLIDTQDIVAFSHSCPIDEWPEEIEVKHQVMVSLLDMTKYLESGIEDIEAWIKKNLTRITKDRLFSESYPSVATTFKSSETSQSSISDDIKKKFSTLAGTAGLEVQQFSSATHIITDILTSRGFEIVLADEEFVTKDSRVKVKLDVKVESRLPIDLKSIAHKLKPYLKPGIDLVDEIKIETRKAVSGKIDELTPQEFYCQFEVRLATEDKEPPAPVGQALTEAIEHCLNQRFGIEKSANKISVKQADTDVLTRLNQLMKESHSFHVQGFTNKGDKTNYEFTYRINGPVLERWSVFQNCGFLNVEDEIAAVSKTLSRATEGFLSNTLPPELIHFKDLTTKNLLRDAIFNGFEDNETGASEQGLCELIAESYGLSISVVAFTRSQTALENDYERSIEEGIDNKKKLSRLKADSLIAEYKSLDEERVQLQIEDSTSPELKRIVKRQAAIEELLELKETPKLANIKVEESSNKAPDLFQKVIAGKVPLNLTTNSRKKLEQSSSDDEDSSRKGEDANEQGSSDEESNG